MLVLALLALTTPTLVLPGHDEVTTLLSSARQLENAYTTRAGLEEDEMLKRITLSVDTDSTITSLPATTAAKARGRAVRTVVINPEPEEASKDEDSSSMAPFSKCRSMSMPLIYIVYEWLAEFNTLPLSQAGPITLAWGSFAVRLLDEQNCKIVPNDVDIAVLGAKDGQANRRVSIAREKFVKEFLAPLLRTGGAGTPNSIFDNPNFSEQNGKIQPVRVTVATPGTSSHLTDSCTSDLKLDFHHVFADEMLVSEGYCICKGIPTATIPTMLRMYAVYERSQDTLKIEALTRLQSENPGSPCPESCTHQSIDAARLALRGMGFFDASGDLENMDLRGRVRSPHVPNCRRF